jgi:hypothetical protein
MNFDQVWPVAAFFLGVMSTLLTETLKARRVRADERLRASASRAQVLQDRRESFELEHLLRVNEALTALTKASADAHNQYVSSLVVSLEARQRVEAANGEVVAVRHLILDDQLRESVRLAHGALLRDGRSAGKPDAPNSEGAVDALKVAREGIAERIRSIYMRDADLGLPG